MKRRSLSHFFMAGGCGLEAAEEATELSFGREGRPRRVWAGLRQAWRGNRLLPHELRGSVAFEYQLQRARGSS